MFLHSIGVENKFSFSLSPFLWLMNCTEMNTSACLIIRICLLKVEAVESFRKQKSFSEGNFLFSFEDGG